MECKIIAYISKESICLLLLYIYYKKRVGYSPFSNTKNVFIFTNNIQIYNPQESSQSYFAEKLNFHKTKQKVKSNHDLFVLTK